MMALMRSRRTMAVVVGLVVLAMVATGAAGLFNALSTPSPQEQEPPRDAPPVSALGTSPSSVGFVDLGQECQAASPDRPGECYRTVGLEAAGDGDLEAEEALEDVRGHLMDQGWEPLLPKGADPDEEVPAGEFVLSDGSVMALASTASQDSSTPAAVVLAHY